MVKFYSDFLQLMLFIFIVPNFIFNKKSPVT